MSFFNSLYNGLGGRNLPNPREAVHIIRSLSLKERLVLYAFILVFVISGGYFLNELNSHFIVHTPGYGGTLSEGIVGVPHFINPLLANSDADTDLVQLVYSGLLRPGPGNTYIPDLAKEYSVTDEGRVYTFTLRDSAVFHDGEPVTSEDVAFTIKLVQDKTIKSPKLPNWEGVVVETPDPYTVRFILKKPYVPFLENTTLGILPKHIWQNVPIEEFSYSTHNANPIGTGPYKVTRISADSGGIPRSYTLSAFNKFSLGKPYIEKIILRFFATEDKLARAYFSTEISSAAGLSPDLASKLVTSGARLEQAPLPRTFALFFNQNQATILSNVIIRRALRDAVDSQEIIDSALHGYGVIATSVIPPNTIDSSLENASNDRETFPSDARISLARQSLINAGWSYSSTTKELVKKSKSGNTKLTISIATINAPELKIIAEKVANSWKELGVDVSVQYYEYGDLTQNVIRPRKFDVLLFGTVAGRFPDPYSFWHSSQRLDPGLNIAQYTNLSADKVLEEARKTVERPARIELYKKLDEEIRKDVPAIFLYYPSFIYIVPKKLGGLTLSGISNSNERFLSVYRWYLEQDAVWKIFTVN